MNNVMPELTTGQLLALVANRKKATQEVADQIESQVRLIRNGKETPRAIYIRLLDLASSIAWWSGDFSEDQHSAIAEAIETFTVQVEEVSGGSQNNLRTASFMTFEAAQKELDRRLKK